MRKNSLVHLLLIISFYLVNLPASFAQDKLSLAGEWQLRLDPGDAGLRQAWWKLPAGFDDTVKLPGSLATNGKGNPVTLDTPWTGQIVDSSYFISDRYEKYRKGDLKMPFWLKPDHYYAGPAWYKKEIEVPADWAKKRVILNLERCHWSTMVYVNGQFCGTRNSLVVPHEFDLSKQLKPGKNTLIIRVDNRYVVNIGVNSHSITDHTQTNWNGLIGDLSLTASSPVYVGDVQIRPKLSTASIDLTVSLQQPRGKDFKGDLILQVSSLSGEKSTRPAMKIPVRFSTEATTLTATYSISNPELWDEFNPKLYQLTAQLVDEQGQKVSTKEVSFGMREVRAVGTRLEINGRPIFLRGDVDCAAFPLTGYSPTDEAAWEKIMKTAKDYGLNHLRFHSWCPPEAAFAVADRLGMYLQIESPLWANQSSAVGTGGVVDAFIYDESERIIRQYGNHPSFCMMAYGNEPGGDNQNNFLGRWVDHFKEKDDRRLYTSGAGWPMIPENQYHNSAEARIQRWGEGLQSIINKGAPRTDFDWRNIIKNAGAPYVSHEIGQWCAYPNFKEIDKYTGILKATNFEIFRETLNESGMGDQAADFLYASGRLQTLCYKADIEAALRTPGFAGFQLLGLHDFPGQGTALVGALDTFWESKGYTTPQEYRTFSNSTVLLARMKKLIYENNETMQAALEIAHFGASELTNQRIDWQLLNSAGKIVQRGCFNKDKVAIDNCQTIGTANMPLSAFKKAEMLTLKVTLSGIENTTNPVTNSWNIWVYPAGVNPDAVKGQVIVANALTPDVAAQLEKGARVLLLPYGHVKKGKGAEVAIGFSSIFWNTSWTENQPPHTLGLVCDPTHPLFASFPTEMNSNYQWHDIVMNSQPIILNNFQKSLRPLIQPIDDWFQNRRLSLAFEVRVGKGKLIVCSVDLDSSMSERTSARQLKYSLLKYMNSKAFNPTEALSTVQIGQLFQQESTLGASTKK
jgi:hypothetical protein